MLARYRLQHELGTGARGAVYAARENGSGRPVAVKLTAREDAACDGGGLAARAPLVHPHIAQVIGSGGRGPLRCVVMELARGTDLRAHAHPANLLPLHEVLFISVRVAEALAHAHAHGRVHGDVKPANILFDRASGEVKLTDFSDPQCEASAGTPAYLAPERLRGSPASPASDQFALGVTLYRLACGVLPFSGASRPQIVQRMLAEPHTDLRAHVPHAPAALAEALDVALAKNPAQRYSTTLELARALHRAASRVGGGAAARTA